MTVRLTLHWLAVWKAENERKRRRRAPAAPSYLDELCEALQKLFGIVGIFALVMHYANLARIDGDLFACAWMGAVLLFVRRS